MTLAEVTRKFWALHPRPLPEDDRSEWEARLADLLVEIEADPDFTLRERIEAMAQDLERPYEPGYDRLTARGMAHRIREALEGK